MTKKEIAILVGAILVVAAGILIGVFMEREDPIVPDPVATPPVSGTQPTKTDREQYYRADIPQNAVPTQAVVEVPATPNSDAKLKVFDLTISAVGFEPATLTARRGDIIQIRATAVGGDFDIEFPYLQLYHSIRAGETKTIGFGANFTGTSDFLCRDMCGPLKGKVGKLIVIP